MPDVIDVLVIEKKHQDGGVIIELLQEVQSQNYRVHHAERFSTALEYLRSGSHDVLLLDQELHTSQIDKAIRLIRDIAPVPVIVVVGQEKDAAGVEALSAGAEDWVEKSSLSRELLVRMIQYAIASRASQVQLLQEKHQFQSTLDALTSHIAIVEHNGHIAEVNRAWEKFERDNRSAVQNLTMNSGYHAMSEAAEGMERRYAERLSAGLEQILFGESSSFEMEYPFEGVRDHYWFHVRITPFPGKGVRCAVIAREDITERKLAEIAMQTSEAQLRAIYDSTPNLVYIKDKNGRYVTVNRAMCTFYDQDEEELLGKTDEELVQSFTPPNWRAHLPQNGNGLEVDIGYYAGTTVQPILDGRGQLHWMKNIRTPISLKSGLDCELGIKIDISDQRKLEEKSRQAEIRLRTILDNLNSKVVLLKPDFTVNWVNKVGLEMAETTREEAIGRRCKDVWGHGDELCTICPVRKSLRSFKVEKAVRTDEDGRTWQIVGCPVIDENNQLMGAVEVSEDITERLQMEGKLRQAQKMESLGTLAGGIAHDFNNILTAILGFTELTLHKTTQLPDLRDDLNEVFRAGLRAKELVTQILTFSRRLEARELQPLKIHLVVKEALKLLRSTLPTSVVFNGKIDDMVGYVMADPTQIHQIVMNLCTNAAHAMEPEGGVLTVDIDEINPSAQFIAQHPLLMPGTYVRLRVSDTGCGMSQELMSSIFDPYFTTKELGEGTGLGLSVVHGIVKEAEGEITVDSLLGEGSTFTVLLPRVKQQAKDDFSHRELDQNLPKGSEHILLVDDEPSILSMFRRVLEQAGYRVTTEQRPEKALQDITAKPDEFDLVLSDVTMPVLTGDRLAARIKDIRPDLPVVLMTGFSNLITEDIAQEIGVEEVLLKPIGRATLIKRIRSLLDDTKQ